MLLNARSKQKVAPYSMLYRVSLKALKLDGFETDELWARRDDLLT